MALRCHKLALEVLNDGSYSSTLTGFATSPFLGNGLAAGTPPGADRACPANSVLIGLRYSEISFGNADSYAAICQSLVTPGFPTVTSLAGLMSGGPLRDLTCPLGRIVTGIAGMVDNSALVTRLTIRCN